MLDRALWNADVRNRRETKMDATKPRMLCTSFENPVSTFSRLTSPTNGLTSTLCVSRRLNLELAFTSWCQRTALCQHTHLRLTWHDGDCFECSQDAESAKGRHATRMLLRQQNRHVAETTTTLTTDAVFTSCNVE